MRTEDLSKLTLTKTRSLDLFLRIYHFTVQQILLEVVRCYAVIFTQNWHKLIKKQKNNWMIAYFFPILCLCKITSSLRFAQTSNYQNCETTYSIELLTIVTKNSMLHVAGFLDLPLVF